eukprot:TRINITY_DN9488_c0_g1_i1.p1 TRINITY_DN9488_c0_g1~~TRINITY_DN9488_c0_g1_i1.p1  ORF type:complete len:363 (-),score=59.88 TRINITY_DN9488_c0_g1_i1:80-1168(-)
MCAQPLRPLSEERTIRRRKAIAKQKAKPCLTRRLRKESAEKNIVKNPRAAVADQDMTSAKKKTTVHLENPRHSSETQLQSVLSYDTSSQEITQSLLQNIGDDILHDIKHPEPGNSKSHPRLSTVALEMRAIIIDWMIGIMSLCGLSRRTFFLFVSLLDSYHAKHRPMWKSDELYLTGLTCMNIAAKVEYFRKLEMKTIVNELSRGKFTAEVIIAKEREILEALKFNLLHTLPIDALELCVCLTAEALKKQGELDDPSHCHILRKLKEGSSILLMMACYDYKMRLYAPYVQALGAICAMCTELSLIYSSNCTGFFAKFTKELQIEDVDFGLVRRCAEELVQLERGFGKKFPGMNNVLGKDLSP